MTELPEVWLVHRHIGGAPVEGGKFRVHNPFCGLMFGQGKDSGIDAAQERQQFDPPGAGKCLNGWQGFEGRNGEVQLFGDFAHEGLRGRFARLDFPAGKFPFPALVLGWPPLGDEHPFRAGNKGTNDLNHGAKVVGKQDRGE